MSFFYDKSIDRKSSIVDTSLDLRDTVRPLPSVVEVSESGTCNRSCSFCPRSAPDFPDIKEFVDPDLIDKLSSQLGAEGYKGIFLFSGFVEPLLDKNICNLVSIVRGNLPDCRIEMVTNGDVLNRERLLGLYDAGLSTLLISAYDGPEEAEALRDLCRDAGLDDDQWVVRDRYLPPEQDFGITLSNRSGLMENAEFGIKTPDEPLAVACHYPHYTFFMDYQGDVLICPHDWGKKLVVGNMKMFDFNEIWDSPAYHKARKRLANADRAFSPCSSCDVKGTLMGKKHVEAWADYYDNASKS